MHRAWRLHGSAASWLQAPSITTTLTVLNNLWSATARHTQGSSHFKRRGKLQSLQPQGVMIARWPLSLHTKQQQCHQLGNKRGHRVMHYCSLHSGACHQSGGFLVYSPVWALLSNNSTGGLQKSKSLLLVEPLLPGCCYSRTSNGCTAAATIQTLS